MERQTDLTGAIPTRPLTHPEVVKPLGHGPVLRRDLRIEVLVETWLQGDELGQGREVVHLFCKEKFHWCQALPRAEQKPRPQERSNFTQELRISYGNCHQATPKDQIQPSLATQILQPWTPTTPLVTNKVTLWPQ